MRDQHSYDWHYRWMKAAVWALLGAMLFLFVVIISNMAAGQQAKIEKEFPACGEGGILNCGWMPGFKAYMADKQRKENPYAAYYWSACVCPCKDAAPDDTCCTEQTTGPVAQSGEHLPCKQGAVGAEPARSTKP